MDMEVKQDDIFKLEQGLLLNSIGTENFEKDTYLNGLIKNRGVVSIVSMPIIYMMYGDCILILIQKRLCIVIQEKILCCFV